MAQVAYNQGAGPDVEPTVSAPDDYQHIQASPNAFGAALAQGAEKFGAGLLQANDFYNQSAADQGTNNLVDKGGALLYGDPNKVNPDGSRDTGLFGKQGQNYMDAYKATHDQLQELIKSGREELPSGQAQRDYDHNSRRWLQIKESEMGQRYDAAQKAWMVNNNTVSGKQALDDISRSAGDDKAFNGYLDNLATSYKKTAFLSGLGSAGEQQAQKNATRDAWKVRLEAINADPNLGGPEKAYQLAVLHHKDIGVDNSGVDEGAALVEKYKKGGEEASVVGAIKTGWAKSLNTPTSELAATGKPGGAPAGAVVYGDSLGAGVKTAYGLGGDAVVGRNPSQVLAAIQSAPAGSLNGKPVVLSSGASNDPSSTDKTADQIAAAVSKGANPADITVMGVGDRPDLKGVNEKLQAIATKAGAKFLPIDPAKLSGDHVHPASYNGILGGAATPSPGTPAGTGQFAPGSFQSALGRTFKEEGGYAARDANGAAVNFGINQAAHPEVNVATLTREQAAQIYKHDYWDAIEGDTLSKSNPALAHVAFDSAVIAGADTAKRWMLQSGGDPAKFMDIRERFLEGLIARDPGKYGRFAAAWRTRDADLRADIGLAPAAAAGGFSPSGVMGAPYTPYTPSPSSALEGAVIQPASVTTPAAEGAKPLDAPPEPETPEEKLERLALIRDATLADALHNNPDWSMAQRQRAEVLAQQEYVQSSIALQMDAHTHKVQKDALGGKIASYMLDGRYDLALGVAHDRTNAYTSQERLALQELIEKKSGMPDPATLGPGHHKIMENVAAEPGSPDRIGVGDNLKILQAMNRGEITAKGAVSAMDWAARVQKSTDQLGVAERINGAIRTQIDDIVHEYDIGEYKVRDPQGKAAIEKYTNAIYAAANQWRDSGKDWAQFPWFKPEYSKEQMLLLYSQRERDQAKYDNEARADPKIDIAKPAPTGTDGSAWSKIMEKPPIIDNGQTIVHKSVWSDVVGDLISNPDADHIAAFNASVIGKAAGFDAETLIQGLTGRAPDVQRGSGAPTPGLARPHVQTEQERKTLDVGGALRGLLHVGEAHPLTETPAQRALRYGVGDKQ